MANSQVSDTATGRPSKGYESSSASSAVLDVELTAEKIEALRLEPNADENTKSSYKLNVSISEVRRRPGSITLSYVLELSSEPAVTKMTVTGTAKVMGPEEEIKQATASRQGKAPPKLVEVLYDRMYGLLYLLAGSLKVPYPMPNLVKSGGAAE